MALVHYKITYLAGDFITLDVSFDETHFSNFLAFLTGYYAPKKRVLEGIPINGTDLNGRWNSFFIWTKNQENASEYLSFYGYHRMYRFKPRKEPQISLRNTAISNAQSLVDSDEENNYYFINNTPNAHAYTYNFYNNNIKGSSLKIESFRQRNVGFLTSACGLILRRGRIDVYEQEHQTGFVTGMTSANKIGIYKDDGSGGSFLIDDNNKSDFLSYLSANGFTAVNEIDMFPI